MQTHELIKALAADSRRTGVAMNTVWWGAVLVAIVVATTIFFALLGPRPDIAIAAQTVRFLFKFVVTIALAASAFALLRMLSRPETDPRGLLPYLVIAPALILTGVAIELIAAPAETWSSRLIGTNSLVCLTFIPLIGIGPLALLLLALRHGAPSHPALAGAIAGLAAGGIAATFYASHCTDDSPLFVATWYTIAITILALFGALGGRVAARW
ncbi:NrsF family protein [Sinorhizobium garamanticum]|uniref:NrsF family protein n=1 Tax=Sinorhizobium garamanticum TaxID=680247 RepID=A0ABY8D641_9HYPH|nr:NrsF family protein [Sinorhizobium garamanticum]WEX86346.1 NrsF family protein [Sinorhizobium garamanticum]